MTAAGLALRTAGLVRFGAAAAIIGGALRVVSVILPLEADSALAEGLYGVIDLGLLFGLIAVYLASAEAIGLAGLAAFLLCLTGIASIVGPDAQAFGLDFYRIGALAFAAGLAGLAVQLIRTGVMRTSAWLWIATLVFGLASSVAPWAFMAAGACLGGGYVLAGLGLMARPPLVRQLAAG